MFEEKRIGKYILQKFIVTLIWIGVAQVLLNILFNQVIGPVLSDVLEIDLIGQELGLKDTIILVFQICLLFLIRLVSAHTSFIFAGFLEGTVGRIWENSNGIAAMFRHVSEVAGAKGVLYPLLVLGCWLFVALIWITPYVIAAVVFGKTISKKVDELEKERINREQEIVKQRNLLLSDVAHDIKTPITTIAGFSQALLECDIEEGKRKEYLESIYAKSMKTVELVNLLFEYVKLDSDGYSLHKTTEDVCEILRGCIARSYTDFEEKSMELILEIPEVAYYMQVDRIQLERAFQNILVNAWKHNPENTKLWVCVQPKEQGIHIKIYDNGIRIEEETSKHLFDPFVQGDKSRTGNRGSGLGLSITRKIIEMHGGRIRLVQYNHNEQYTKAFEIVL